MRRRDAFLRDGAVNDPSDLRSEQVWRDNPPVNARVVAQRDVVGCQLSCLSEYAQHSAPN